MNALARLLRSSASRAEGSVVTDARTSLTLGDAVRQGDEIAREVARIATRRCPMVAVVLPSSVEAVTQLLAAVLGDHNVCFLDPSNRQRTDAVLSSLDPDVVVDASGLHPRRGDASPAARSRSQLSGTTGYVAMSSGTTGTGPKGVLTSWECLAAFVPHGVAALQVEQRSRWAEPNHPSYDLAITNWLVALGGGASLHVSSALKDRMRPLAFVARRGATHVRWAPGYVDLAAAEARRGTRCEVRIWGSGGDRLSVAHATTVLGLGVTALINTYGTSETAGFASTATYTSTSDLRALDGSVSIGRGRLGPWRVELEPEQVGDAPSDVLTVHSPHVGDGYLFGGQEQDYPRWELGRVVTGDIGVEADGDLFCFGRVGRLVKRKASFVNLDDVDAVLRELRGLATFTVATRAGSLVTLIEGEGHPIAGVRDDLATRIGPGVLPDAFVQVPALPRLGNGKADQAGALLMAERALEQDG